MKFEKVFNNKKYIRKIEGMGAGLVLFEISVVDKRIGQNYHLFYEDKRKPPLDIAINPEGKSEASSLRSNLPVGPQQPRLQSGRSLAAGCLSHPLWRILVLPRPPAPQRREAFYRSVCLQWQHHFGRHCLPRHAGATVCCGYADFGLLLLYV